MYIKVFGAIVMICTEVNKDPNKESDNNDRPYCGDLSDLLDLMIF